MESDQGRPFYIPDIFKEWYKVRAELAEVKQAIERLPMQIAACKKSDDLFNLQMLQISHPITRTELELREQQLKQRIQRSFTRWERGPFPM